MHSLIEGYENDIFISYRQKDNKYDGWVTEFVVNLKKELEATFKEDITIYFDENQHDGLLESHNVDKSLSSKIKSLVLIPILSQTYCDSQCFAWQSEFVPFIRLAGEDQFGRDISLSSGNVASRILPIQIHDLDPGDIKLLEDELKGKIRSIDFIYREPGVNRPLLPKDDAGPESQSKSRYRNQINKVANAVKEIIAGLKSRAVKERVLMTSLVNEQLIKAVFDEAVKHKPSLTKYLILDEDENEIDLRILADQIIKIFPLPIGVELRRLFSGSVRIPDQVRLNQLLKTIERTLHLVSFIMVIELFEKVKNGNIRLEGHFQDEFNKRFLNLSMTNSIWLIREIGQVMEKQNHRYFMTEMKESLNGKFYDALEFWIPECDENGNYKIDLAQAEIEKKCSEYQNTLTFLLQDFCYIIRYKLVNMREIKVLKKRNLKPRFEHFIDILNSSESSLTNRQEVLETFSDSRAVLLMKSTKEPNEFLNLSPLIIDTRTVEVEAKDKFNLRKDIFLYTKSLGNKIHYAGTEVTEKCDMSSLSNFEELVNDFSDILHAVGQGVQTV